MVEMVIHSIRASVVGDHRVVILRERRSQRYLALWTGPAGADAIAVALEHVELERPLTHDLMWSVITTLGADVSHVLLDDVRAGTFLAKVALLVNENERLVDCRPADALALAVRAGAPIYADEAVLTQAGLTLEECSSPVDEGMLDAEETERLSAFEDFIKELDLEDFERRNS